MGGKEFAHVELLSDQMNDEQWQQFAIVYGTRRRDEQQMLILSIVGLVFIPGIQRFFVNQIGMGILYLFTVGLCLIGSIIDIVNHKDLAFEYNKAIANEIATMM